MARGP
jgi:hypothetical protein